MSAATLSNLLPVPRHRPSVQEVDESQAQSSTAVVAQPTVQIPPYGRRRGWKPRKQEDFGNGGAYPECSIAQYPLEMGRKKQGTSGNTLALQVDGEGNVRYDAIAQQGHRDGRTVQSQFKDLVPMANRTDVKDRLMERPSEEEVAATAEKTKAALEKLVNGKIKAAQPKNVPNTQGQTSYIRYTPGQQGGDGTKQRVIKMSEVVEDPLEPPRFKYKKIPRGPPSPPAPVLRSPPRKVTAQEQKEWMIPPCISNWKNNKGYTIPLDKRLAADGRGLQDVHINDNFAQFSEALYLADRHAREEVRQRSVMQQKLAQKEKAAKEEHLRNLAQRAREERGGSTPSAAAGSSSRVGGVMPSALAGYGSESESGESDNDEEGRRQRDELRREKRQEREREMRMSNMGTEQRAKMLAREQNRDISEKVALGLAKPTMSKESMTDSRLYNQEALSNNFGDEDSYNIYDKPLFTGSAATQIDRFGLGATKGFEGADLQEVREGPVQFEKDTLDPFGVDKFLDEAKKGTKRGLDNSAAESRKRQRE